MSISSTELNDFTRDFSRRVDAGESLTAGLAAIAATTLNLVLGQAAADCVRQLGGGSTLSQAMARYPAVFDAEYLAVIRRGETSGRLDDALRILA